MATQNYGNHRQFVPMFHGVLFFLLVLTLIGSCVNLYHSWDDHARLYSASLILVLDICMLMFFSFVRIFPLKAQDRAIRAEENLRHFSMAGKLLDPRLTVRQVIALRFASNGEFVALAERAAKENLSPNDIKKAIKDWKADTYRV